MKYHAQKDIMEVGYFIISNSALTKTYSEFNKNNVKFFFLDLLTFECKPCDPGSGCLECYGPG